MILARKIEERKRKKERKLEEKLKQSAEDENEKKAKEKKPAKANEKVDVSQFLSDPEILEGFLNPEILAAFKEISENPANFLKYHKNPEIVAFIEKVGNKLGTGTADVFEMMANMPSFSGKSAPQFNTPKSSQQPQDDVDLD